MHPKLIFLIPVYSLNAVARAKRLNEANRIAQSNFNILWGQLYRKLNRASARLIIEYVSSVWNPQQQFYYLEDEIKQAE